MIARPIVTGEQRSGAGERGAATKGGSLPSNRTGEGTAAEVWDPRGLKIAEQGIKRRTGNACMLVYAQGSAPINAVEPAPC